jgi:hypothetical protein
MNRHEAMQRISLRLEFDFAEVRVRGFWSAKYPDFYIATVHGFPYMAWFKKNEICYWCYPHEAHPLGNGASQLFAVSQTAANQKVTPDVIFDIYKRGIAGLIKHRLLGGLR